MKFTHFWPLYTFSKSTRYKSHQDLSYKFNYQSPHWSAPLKSTCVFDFVGSNRIFAVAVHPRLVHFERQDPFNRLWEFQSFWRISFQTVRFRKICKRKSQGFLWFTAFRTYSQRWKVRMPTLIWLIVFSIWENNSFDVLMNFLVLNFYLQAILSYYCLLIRY